jgi:glyoxylate reductase
MKKKILVTCQIPKEGLKELFEKFDVYYPEKEILTYNDLCELIPPYHGVLTVFTCNFPADVIEKAKNLRIISNYGAGVNNIELEYATEKGIVVTNTPDIVTESTAEITFGLMLSVMRRISECDRKIRKENGLKWGIMENLGYSLYGKKLGIIGMGKIGKATARRAIASGMNIFYYDRGRLPEELEKLYEAQYLSLNKLLEASDVLSIHCPLSQDTYHLIGREELIRMKPTSFLINAARGAIIDENALVEVLKQNKIAGAGLDVFENEPDVHPDLLQMDNVVLVPHIGTGTIETRINMGKSATRNIIDFFEGRQPKYIVNPETI